MTVARQVQVANIVAVLLDNKFSLFGIRFGLSSIIDIIPGFGDIIDALLASYILFLAIQLQLPTRQLMQMIWNILFSFLVGLFPIIGDAAYIFYKPNLRNITILKEYTDKTIDGEIVR